MGQTGSAQLETSLPEPVKAEPLPVKKVPPPRPSSPPKRPRSPSKGPKYAKPENRVLPLGDLTPRKLRPISQEISKVKYPEFADLFHGRELDDDIENEEAMEVSEDDSKDNAYYKAVYAPEENMGSPRDSVKDNADVHRQPNGVLANGTAHTDRSSSEEDTDTERGGSGVRRSHSLDRAPARPKGHRRQPSRTTSLMNEEHTIFEDPRESLAENREHLYDNWRKDPYMNNPSNVVSLPVRSNFDLDVKLNMTYAQLAEHRRQKNLEELKKKTGISVESLQSDLTENSNLPFNPFQRQASRESTRSSSTASSETGVSKRKKKRAPPPPGTKTEDMADEPPIDYDLDEPVPPEKPYARRSSIISNASILSAKSKPAPAPPKVNPLPDPMVSKAKATSSLPQAPSTSLPEESSLPIPPPAPQLPESKEKVDQAQDAIKKLDRLLSEENGKDNEIEKKSENKPKSPTVSSPEKRLNALVSSQSESEEDPDRVRILKPKIPPLVVEKEKDESQLFREKLQKAYEERTKRKEEELKRKEEAERKLKEKREEEARKKEEEGSISARSEKKHGESVEILRRLSRDLDKKWLSAHKPQTPVTSAHETDDDLSSKESKSSGQQRVFSSDWTPEDDLDSDDDIEDKKTVFSHQRNTSEGFKSSILPTKFNELKKNGKGKYIRKQADSSNDDKQKYGSIRKLKKTVNKSVRNAFGSISRASGKLLRKQRSMDFEDDPPPPPPSNWHLSSSTHQLNGDTQQIERRLSQGNILTSDEESSVSDSEEVMPQPEPIPSYHERQRQELNGQIRGYAASMQNGIPNGTTEEDSSRMYKKKKKKGAHVANGKQPEVYQVDPMTEKIKQTRRQIEAEKQRQMEIEREMLRLKALEQEERFQRMQTAHFHQQLQVLQQSVAPGQSQLTAPPLPPAGGLHSYSVPDFTQQQHAYPHMMSQGMPGSPMSPGMPFNNGNNGLTSFDINYLSNLMRMNGVQPPASPQQWAYLLNSVSLPSQPLQTKGFYQTSEVPPHARQVKSMYVTSPAPDLTTMFAGQSFDDSQIRSKKSMMDFISAKKQSQSFSNLSDRPTEPIRMDSLLHDYERSASLSNQTEKTKQRANPMYYSSDEEDLTSGLSPARTSRNYVASVQVKDYRPLPNLQPGMADVDANGQMYTAYHVKTAPTHRQRTPGEDSSSSGADR